jgi:hypothetical protein
LSAKGASVLRSTDLSGAANRFLLAAWARVCKPTSPTIAGETNLIEADELGSTLVRAVVLLILLVFVRGTPAHAMGGLFDTNSKGPDLRHHHHHHHHQTTTSGYTSGGNEASGGNPTGDTGSHTNGPIGDPLPDVKIPASDAGLPGPGVGGPANLDSPTPLDVTDDADRVPLPGTLSLFGGGLIVIGLIAWLRRHRPPRRKAVCTQPHGRDRLTKHRHRH